MRHVNLIALGIIVLVVGLLAQPILADTVVYREIFPNEGSEDASLDNAGWSVIVANDDGFSGTGNGIASGSGLPVDAEPVNSGYSGTERAKSYVWFDAGWGNTPRAMMWSYEPGGLANTADISSISWYEGNESGDVYAHAGVKVGEAWYVSATGYSQALPPGPFVSGAEQKIVDFATAQWNPLVWSANELYRNTSQTVALPAGELQATALYFEGCSGTIRVDTFTITAVPEPCTVSMMITGALGLLIWVWQRRKN